MTENSKSTKPQPAKVEWYYERDGAVVGPITEARLRYSVKYGHIKPDTLIWRSDFDHWLEAMKVPLAAAAFTSSNRAPSSPGIEATSTAIRLRVEPAKEEAPDPPQFAETQPQASSPEHEDEVGEVLHDAVTDEEAADPVIDVNMARAIVERASGRPMASSIAPASITFRPPSNGISWGIRVSSRAPKLITIGGACVLLVVAALMVALRSRPKTAPMSGVPKILPSLRTEPTPVARGATVRAAPTARTQPVATPNPVGAGSLAPPAPAPAQAGLSEEPSPIKVEGPINPKLFLEHLKRSVSTFDEQCWGVYRVPGMKVESDPSVNIALDIDRTGHVYDATSGKAPTGYRGVGRCIAGRMRGWKFPPADSGTHAVVTVKRVHD